MLLMLTAAAPVAAACSALPYTADGCAGPAAASCGPLAGQGLVSSRGKGLPAPAPAGAVCARLPSSYHAAAAEAAAPAAAVHLRQQGATRVWLWVRTAAGLLQDVAASLEQLL